MTPDEKSLGGEATFSGQGQPRPPRDDVSIGDERTLGGGDAAGIDTVIDDIEIADFEARYTIEGTLGRGGMGEVLLALDTRLDRRVAIKRILGEAARSRTAVLRFLTEAKAIAALNHPNIVQIYDYGRAKDGPFLVMEFVGGGSLADRCKQGAVPVDVAVNLACQLCDGLAKAHEAGIVHRDIKPANVLLNMDEVPKLTDFGLAKAEAVDHGMTMTGAVMGTPDFMPPEQRRDAALVDHRSDLWSLAATLYQAVTGRSPKVINLRHAPDQLQEVLGRALEDEKDARYQSARDLRDALRAAMRGAGPAVVPAENGGGDVPDGLCKTCGTINPDVARKFCKKCGASLRVACLKCDAQIPVWDAICGLCGGNQSQLAVEIEHVAEARKHLAAFDYASAAHALETIPDSFRREETSRMLAESRSRQAESEKLVEEIRLRIKRKEIDGLLPTVARAAELRGDREDLAMIRQQLVERRDRRLQRAQAALGNGNARAAVVALEGAVAGDFGPQAELIDRARKAAGIETRLAEVLKDAKADGVISPVEASAILKLGSEYLAVNGDARNVQALVAQCREILAPKLIRNSVRIELKRISAGTFRMGPKLDRPVTLTMPFYLGVYPVTNAQWKQVMGAIPGYKKGDDLPVVRVSWDDAVEFCRKLSALPEERQMGRVYRLPTEAEWEYACRAGTTTTFSFGDDSSRLGEYAWFEGNSGGDEHPIGQKKPNPWGLYDMLGNVWEWCSDWLGEYGNEGVTDPQGPSSGFKRVLRGGAYYSNVGAAESAHRWGCGAMETSFSAGFRLALTLPEGALPPEGA